MTLPPTAPERPVERSAAPDLPGAPLVKQTERPHPLTPFVRGWLVLVAIAFGMAREFIPDGRDDGFDDGDLGWILPVIGGVVLLAAVAGFFSWYFTRFVIDDDELRVETGAIFKNSKKVPFERLQSVDIIQPLAARVFGLAELRLEAGAGDSTIKLRYLRRGQASRLRDYLLARAHGQRARLGDVGEATSASLWTDLGAADRPLVVVPPQRLVLGFVLSSEWLVAVAVAIVILVVTGALGALPLALSGLVPMAIGLVSLVGRRVIAMFNFTLAESPRGLRVTRGLTNLTSQSVPVNRVQGVKISQPLLWRLLGWSRVDVDILGYHGSDSENNEANATSVLLPVATAPEVAAALARVLPGLDLEAITRLPSPRRTRWVRWFDFWTLRYGWDDRALVTEHGWLTHVREVVPHAKTQSVRIEQGPLQRLLRLANVHIDTPKGPVNAVAQEIDASAARDLALSQLDRARAARAAERTLRESQSRDDWDPIEAEILAAYGTGRDRLLGEGGESEVFALDEHRVLRLYRARHEAPDQTASQLRVLYDGWRDADLGLELPLILDAGHRQGRAYTVDRRFSGRGLSGWLSSATPEQRRPVLLGFLDAATQLQRLPSPLPGFARLVGPHAGRSFPSLAELLADMLARPAAEGRADLQRDVPDAAVLWDRLHADLAQRHVAPALVHGDLCPANTYVTERSDGSVAVTGVGDFSPHTTHGDPLMDIAGAVIFLEFEAYPDAAADGAWLQSVAEQRWGAELARWITVYRHFYAFYYSNTARAEPPLYAWCVRQLRTAR